MVPLFVLHASTSLGMSVRAGFWGDDDAWSEQRLADAALLYLPVEF